jgi:tRNA(Arg) A34 adenosine deaminase TadA
MTINATSAISNNAIATIAVATVAVVAHAVAYTVVRNNNNKNNKSKNKTQEDDASASVIQKTAPFCDHHDHHNHGGRSSVGGGCTHTHTDDESVVITLPPWTKQFVEERKDKMYTTDEEMMQVAMDVADRNITEGTGGPFGTAIFEHDVHTGKTTLFCVGMNQVVALGNSTLHGEMTAIQFGEKKLGKFAFPRADRKTRDMLGSTKEYHLYTSCAPCAQCLGGTLWSGVAKLVCGADKSDAEAIGFDEGPVFPSSYDALEAAGCTVKHGVLRELGARILRRYAQTGVIYNADST